MVTKKEQYLWQNAPPDDDIGMSDEEAIDDETIANYDIDERIEGGFEIEKQSDQYNSAAESDSPSS